MRSNKRKEGKPSHIVSAWSREDGFCLGQRAVSEKSNEITAIPELLDRIQIKGQIVTIDAMGTQKAIAEKIRKKRADYVLAVKGNQSGLYEDISLYFGDGQMCRKARENGGYTYGRESTRSDGEKGISPDNRHRMALPEERMERHKKHWNGGEDDKG